MAADTEFALGAPQKAKIFISYSRKDMAFADRLEAALAARGFQPLIDRTEIYAFEDFWNRIQALIGQADTVVCVLSPDAVTSEWALREVAHAAALNKRFAPIVCRRVDDGAVPEPLRRLNFIFFDDPAQFAADADRLAEALRTDIAWIRKHTEYGETGRRWTAAGRPDGLLLRSPALEEAERWIASRPASAPAITDDTREYILESRRVATRRRNTLTASLGAGLAAALLLAGLAAWQWREAAAQRDRAEHTVLAATGTADSLVRDVAQTLRETTGVPTRVVSDLLDRMKSLQDQLVEYNGNEPLLQRSRAVARREISQTLALVGDNDAALRAALDAQTIVNALLATDPTNRDLRRDLSITFNRIGEALARGGRGEEALEYFSKSLAIRLELAAVSQDVVAQTDLAVIYERIGDEHSRLGRDEAASQDYRASLEIREALVAAEPDDTQLQFDLAASYDRMAMIAGCGEDALTLFRKSLAVREKLIATNAQNADWQAAVAASYDNIGNCLLTAGHTADALVSFQHGFDIRRRLAEGNPEVIRWQAFLAVSLYNLGRAGDNARDRYTHALDIVYKLAVAEKLPQSLRALPAAIEARLKQLPE